MRKRILISLLLLALVMACSFPMLGSYMERQFGPHIGYEDASFTTLPDGTCCVYRECSLLDRLLIVFYRGEELTADNHPVFASLPRESTTHYYRIKGYDNLAALIATTPGSAPRILRPSGFSGYCPSVSDGESPLSHDAIFPAIMERIYGCTDASDIATIYLEPLPDSNSGIFSSLTSITNPVVIGRVWDILLESVYDCGLEQCPDAVEAQALLVDNNIPLTFPSRRRVTLEFTDGSQFAFSAFDGYAHVLWFDNLPAGTAQEALYLTEEQNTQLVELLGIG